MELLQSDILADIIHYESTKFHPEFMPMPCSTLLHYNAGHIKSRINKKKIKQQTDAAPLTSAPVTATAAVKGIFFFNSLFVS